jgi:tetratricopeptide (TPR) repeat protein
MLTGQRYDLGSLNGGAMHTYFPGFDFFFFDRAAANALAHMTRPFAMGVPWWDYWFPLSLLLRGYNVQSLTRPAVLHLQHDQQVTGKTPIWRTMAREFARAMLHDSRGAHLSSPHWHNLTHLCRAVDETGDATFEAGACDQQIIDMSMETIPLIANNMVERAKGSRGPYPSAIPAGTFDNLAERAASGTALVRGLWDEDHDNLPRAEWQFERAAQFGPLDPSVLFECANFFYRQGKMQRAAELLARAVERKPDSPVMLNSLGSALGYLSRNEEAAACFERAIAADPLYGGSYYNLAVVLWLKNRHGEVVRRLEERMAQAPDFPDGAEWLQRIRETLSRFDRETAGRRPSR